MPAEPPRFDPERLLEVLDRHRVDYIMVGGFASQLHGARRQTYDIDFVPAATEANDDRLSSALRELGARLRVAGLTDEESRHLLITIDAATLRAFGSTTWTHRRGPARRPTRTARHRRQAHLDELIQRCTDVSVHGIVIHLASLDDIIDSKTHADRPKDHDALPELHHLRGTTPDP